MTLHYLKTETGVHLRNPQLTGLATMLCGLTFGIGSTLAKAATTSVTVTCPGCIAVIKELRAVRTRLPTAPRPRKPRTPNLLSGVKAGTELIFKDYRADHIEPPHKPFFTPGERITVVEKYRDYDTGMMLYACVRAVDYEKYLEAPDGVDGDEVYSDEIQKLPKVKP